MEVYTQAEVEKIWSRSDEELTVPQLMKDWTIHPAFEYDGMVRVVGGGEPSKMVVRGYFYLLDSEPGLGRHLKVKSFSATPDVEYPEDHTVDERQYYFGGPLTFEPCEPKSVHVTDFLVTEEEFERICKEHGLPRELPQPLKMSTKERENLLRLVGVLVRMFVGRRPSAFTKTSSGELNATALVDAIRDYMRDHGIDRTGLSERRNIDRLNEGSELLPRWKPGEL